MKPSASSNSKLKVGTGGEMEMMSSKLHNEEIDVRPSSASGGGGGSL